MKGSLEFSFSGLKTSVAARVAKEGVPEGQALADLCASFQAVVTGALSEKLVRAAEQEGVKHVVLGGGVAANRTLLRRVEELAQMPVLCPPPRLCTDNAAMIASAGFFRYHAGERADFRLDVEPGMPIA